MALQEVAEEPRLGCRVSEHSSVACTLVSLACPTFSDVTIHAQRSEEPLMIVMCTNNKQLSLFSFEVSPHPDPIKKQCVMWIILHRVRRESCVPHP